MANRALRRIFLDAAITLAGRGNTEAARMLNSRVRQADAEDGMRRGRKRGEVVAARLLTPEEPMPISRCDWCGDAGSVCVGGSEQDCPECRP